MNPNNSLFAAPFQKVQKFQLGQRGGGISRILKRKID
jgi:hypothetical protein